MGEAGASTSKKQSRGSIWVESPGFRICVGIAATILLIFSIKQATTPPPPEISSGVVSESYEPIAGGKPVELIVPSIGMVAHFEPDPCRVKDDAIDPATLDKACIYTAEDKPYSLPGTDSPDIVVIAGHTGAGISAVFNQLYDGGADEHKVKVGDKLYLKTENSQEHYLVYEATDLHSPQKNAMASDAAIWGEKATPGRLLTISCIQPSNVLLPSVRNAVVGWKFIGVNADGAEPTIAQDESEAPAP